jgi:hypothetical protein
MALKLIRTINFNDADVAVGATSATITVTRQSLGFRADDELLIKGGVVETVTPFAGGSLATYTAALGIAGATTRYLAAQSVFAAARLGAAACALDRAGNFVITLTGSHNLSTATAGKAHIWADIEEAKPLPA